jgi:amphi-Trp domain-containing protein
MRSPVSDKKKIEVRGHATPQEVSKHLHALADSFASGRVVIEQGHRFVALETRERTELELEAEQKKDKARLTISLSWSSALPASFGDSLKISADVPPERPVIGDEDDEDGDEDDDDVKTASYEASQPQRA